MPTDDPDHPAPAAADEPAIPTTPGELTAPLIDGMPEVTTPAGPEPPKPTPAVPVKRGPGRPRKNSGRLDKDGVEFDPEIHSHKPDGHPLTNEKGQWRKRLKAPNWYKFKETGILETPTITPTFDGVEDPNAPRQAPAAAEAAKTQTVRIDADKLAGIAIPILDRFAQGVLTEGAALNDADRAELRPALTAYIESTNMKDIPPGLMLAMVVSSVYASKLSQPSVKERLMLYAVKVKSFFGRK